MLKTAYSWFKGLTAAGRAGVVIASVVGLSAVSAATNNNQQTPKTPEKPKTTQNSDVIVHKTITETEAIAYATKQVEDNSLAKGTSKTTTEGVDGARTITYNVTYKNGIETSRVKVSEEITTQPTDRIVAIGTYVAPQSECPNGTYVNSSGNIVCRPYESSSAPTGATAKCYDGTYSFSQHRSGTCSRHGGVAEWL